MQMHDLRDMRMISGPGSAYAGSEVLKSFNGIGRAPEPAGVVTSIDSRFRGPSMLFFGALAGFLAFGFVLILGVINFFVKLENQEIGVTYASGRGYWPQTVSEAVHDTTSPSGRIFFAFCLIAAMCIFVSFYPYNLRNVYTGSQVVGCTSLYWMTFRQLVPGMGLVLLICVPTYPAPEAAASPGYTKEFCVALHLIGAFMMFIGYLVCELKCMDMLCFKNDTLLVEGAEKTVRQVLVGMLAFGFLLFSIAQIAIMFIAEDDTVLCCHDKWYEKGSVVNVSVHSMIHGIPTNVTLVSQITTPQVYNTAYGWALMLKIFSYGSECIAGCALLASHLAIHAFCEERNIDYGSDSLTAFEPLEDGENIDPYLDGPF